jgi:hypothetical protein
LLCFMRGRRITPLFRNQVLADLIKDGLIEQVSLPVIRILVAYKIAT